MMMINKKRTPLKPRIHDQILKQVGEAAHQDPDKREPDLENKSCWPCALPFALKKSGGPGPSVPSPKSAGENVIATGTKLLIEDIVFTSPTGDGTAISRLPAQPSEGLAVK